LRKRRRAGTTKINQRAAAAAAATVAAAAVRSGDDGGGGDEDFRSRISFSACLFVVSPGGALDFLGRLLADGEPARLRLPCTPEKQRWLRYS